MRDEDWSTSWKRYYEPSRIAPGLYVVPSWRKDFRAPHGASTIVLDPGMAFGTGLHPTTKMALSLLLPLVRPGGAMLDIGCGSGILAIAAAQRGAHSFASDIDPIAVSATRANFRANGLTPSAVRRASGIPGTFPVASLVASNITSDVLAPMATTFVRSLTPGGALVTSGVTELGRREMLDAFARAGLALETQRHSGEWFAFVHRRAGEMTRRRAVGRTRKRRP